MPKSTKNPDEIRIVGAREHNLKNVNLTLPRQKLTVFTGVSGSGKSSLAFDTIYAEGQRRYVESLSSYARQFLGLMEKPEIDHIDGLSPAISIDQKGISKNPRSTVGTVTEIYDYLRLLWARIGKPHCPNCGRVIGKQSLDQISDQLFAYPKDSKVAILAPMVRTRKGEHQSVLTTARALGYSRVRVDGVLYPLEEAPALDKKYKHSLEILIDRINLAPENKTRLVEALEAAAALGGNTILAISLEEPPLFEPEYLSLDYACPVCGISIEEPQPRNFSFNSPHGACPTCTGLGLSMEISADSLITDPKLTLNEGVLTNRLTGAYRAWIQHDLLGLARRLHYPINTPWEDYDKKTQDNLLYAELGHGSSDYRGIIKTLEARYKYTESAAIKEEIEQFMLQKPCPVCHGKRLKPEYLSVTIGEESISDFTSRSIVSALERLESYSLTEKERLISHQILKEVRERLCFLLNVGLDYLTLDRRAGTLSGGESQRIRLATQIGSRLVGVLYVLDEPSIGLHPRDNHKLLSTLQDLRDLGNTLIVVEHDEDTIRIADYIVDIGPGAGVKGGHVVAEGPYSKFIKDKNSLTAKYLRGEHFIPLRTPKKGNGKQLLLKGARANNLRSVNISFPLGCFICITGPSGSGKSSLITDTLFPALAKILQKTHANPAPYKELLGIEHLDKVINIDQSPIGRTPRSNPATYTGLFTGIRELFALLPESRIRGYKPGRFSFNIPGGRCETCSGDGQIKIEMHFLPDIYVPCEACRGKRYNHEALEVKFKGNSIADVLALTVDEALRLFSNQPLITRRLQTLQDVGIGYIALGQPATQLSGGEAQRVKLSTELSKRATGRTFYLLDEPTTGLHIADVDKLLTVLHRLVDSGNTVLVIEHNLEVVKTADWIIDLGPGGGDAGGRLMAAGTPQEVAASKSSPTGPFLKPFLSNNGTVLKKLQKSKA